MYMVICIFMTLSASGKAGFLAAQPQVSTAVLRNSLWAKLGSRAKPFPRLLELETELGTPYAALPKNEYGNIERAVVNYAARRYFLHNYGWHVKGLESNYNATSSSGTSNVGVDMVPSYVLGIFDEYTGERGFTLRDLAIFLATLEDVVNADMLNDVMNSYRLHGFPTAGRLPSEAVDEILVTYMASYVAGINISNVNLEEFKAQKMEETYPGWADTVMWVSDVRREVAFNNRNRANPFAAEGMDVTAVEHIVTALGRQYGSFQDLECRSLKNVLLAQEHRSTGRVLLSDFYKQGLSVDWQFTESVRYLRDLGALDESTPARPSVLVPNYLNGPSNCLISTSFYTVCCIDECNGLFHQLENSLATPSAEARHVVEVISNLASDTVHAPRNLSEDLHRRLYEIAEHHDGSVPIHGRLFAQWMHYAYPRECPFPHVSGTTAPMTQDEWVRLHGPENIMASETEKHAYVVSNPTDDGTALTHDLLWHPTEELLASHVTRQRRSTFAGYGKQSWLLSLGKAVLFVAPLSLAAQLLRDSVGRLRKSAKGDCTGSYTGRDFFV